MSGFDAILNNSTVQDYWLRRVVAFIIDAIVVYVIVAILVGLSVLPFLFISGAGFLGSVFAGAFAILAGLGLFLYFVGFEISAGGSIGKKVMRLKVVAASGGVPGIGQAMLRNVTKLYWLLLLLDVVIGLAVSKEYTKKLTDTYAGTVVSFA